MNTHSLKTWPEFWYAVYEGRKTFELRRDDRGFRVGDGLLLRLFDPARRSYQTLRQTPAETETDAATISCVITHLIRGCGLNSDYVGLSFRKGGPEEIDRIVNAVVKPEEPE